MKKNEHERPVGVAEVFEVVIARLIEAEQQIIQLQRAHLEQATEIRRLATALKIQQDEIETSHARNQESFATIADSLAALTLKIAPPATGPQDVN